ncbi:unnamed protein product [Oncorhynchus mykiss]|uniref:Cadherin domain-containing protein n=1 Tax=Oncorhynchus mykiss TaxID=8022 RepID=A0A060Z3X3_ONCMY|nr:unnamed protein product [Oncorhynchus mykiss]
MLNYSTCEYCLSDIETWYKITGVCHCPERSYCLLIFYPIIFLFAQQGGLSAQTYVHIEVDDLNDNPPVFNPEKYVTSVSSHAQPGTEVLNVIATDRDSGDYGHVTYQILAGDLSSLFSVDKTTGRMTAEISGVRMKQGCGQIFFSIQ